MISYCIPLISISLLAFFNNPCNTLPGPISRNEVAPSAIIFCMICVHLTDAVSWAIKFSCISAGTVWGFIDETGHYAVNPQYNAISADYLHQALGEGSIFTTLDIAR